MVGMGLGFRVYPVHDNVKSGHVPSGSVLETNTELWGPLLIVFKPLGLMVK